MADQQNLQNHAKYDPAFHFVLIPILGFNLIYRIVALVRHLMNGETSDWIHLTGGVVLAFAILLLAFKARIYSLKMQDRIIRLEERLRLATLLPEPLRARIPELTRSQLIALRFASDEEVVELARAALDQKLGNKEIKQSIRNWRPDHLRV
jgi:hypothetical protein